ncbi:hypothetical protein [Streptomyces sp. NPDC051554]|uniref:hypothetical protein n=1 Tax=Streptomyces sp. NPDC051554 TaxID=3365656 RepID=UPI0037B1EB95
MGRLRLRAIPVGDALLIHPKGRFDDRAAAFAGGIAEDPHHTVVVVDLPADALAEEWMSVARLLSPSRYGSPRLVFGRGSGDEIRTAGSLIADRLGREVLAPDGDLVPTATGGLFVPGEDGSAWLRFRPGRDPEPEAQRFPKPHWEFSAPIRTAPVGGSAVAQPVPAGVWLRHADRDPLTGHHRRTVEALPTDLHLFLIVLGSPGTPPLSLDDVSRFWDTVLPGVRSAVRFLLYGALDVPDSREPGQALADALGHQVVVYIGPGSEGPERPGGTSELVYFPAGGPTTDPMRLPRIEPPALPTPVLIPAPVPARAALGASTLGHSLPRVPTESGGTSRALPAGAVTAATITPDSATLTMVPPHALAPAPVMRVASESVPPPVHDPSPCQGESGAVGDLSEAPTVRNDNSATDLSEAPTVRNDAGTADPDAESGPGYESGAVDLEDAPTVLSRPRVGRRRSAVTDPEPESAPGQDAPVPEPSAAVARTPVPASAATPVTERTPVSPRFPETPTGPVPKPVAALSSDPGASSGPGRSPSPVMLPEQERSPSPMLSPEPGRPLSLLPSPEPSLWSGPEPSPEPSWSSAARALPDPAGASPPAPSPEPGPSSAAGSQPEPEPFRLSVPELSPDLAPSPGPAPASSPDLEPSPDLATLSGPACPPVAASASTPTSAPIPVPASAPAPLPAPAERLVPPATPRFRLESAAPVSEIDEIQLPEPAAEPVRATRPSPSVAGVSAPDDVGDGPALVTRTGDATAPSSRTGDALPDVRVQPAPRTTACALPPERGIAQERDWVRRTFSEQYNAVAGSVSRVMSESPGLRGRSRTEAADALTELVAVRLYLSGDSRRADAAVREAAAGPHVPLARCVTAGLRRLPSYRGPALLRTRLGEAERAWYREGRVATEWAFCHARTSLHPGPRGSGATDVLIWSMTARRTSSLDPGVPDRVLFLPGTAFKVLRTEGSVVLMRELSPSEIAEDGRVDVQRVKLDEIALKGLEKILDALEKAGTDAGAESADPPGLIVRPRAVRTEGANS